ncbi:hypothetical protein THAOC_23066, partial [Thalassiosira oceanica]
SCSARGQTAAQWQQTAVCRRKLAALNRVRSAPAAVPSGDHDVALDRTYDVRSPDPALLPACLLPSAVEVVGVSFASKSGLFSDGAPIIEGPRPKRNQAQ